MSKEPNGTLVMTSCKCRENNTNLVMTRKFFDERLESKVVEGIRQERERIIKLLDQYAEESGMYPLVRDELFVLIKGEN